MANEVKVVVTGQDKSGPAFASLDKNVKQATKAHQDLASQGTSKAEVGFGKMKGAIDKATPAVLGVVGGFVAVNEVLNKGVSVSMAKANAEVALGSAAFDQMSAAADKNANRMGFTTGEFIETAGSAAALATNLGFSQAAAGKLGAAFPDLADKLATLSNGHATTAEAAEQLRSAMAGEYDPLQSLGIAINAAAVETEALAIQQRSLTPITKEQATAMAVLSIVNKQTANATKVATTEAGRQAAEAQKSQARLKQAYEDLAQESVPALSRVTAAAADLVAANVDLGKALADPGSWEKWKGAAGSAVGFFGNLIGVTKDEGTAASGTKLEVDKLSEGAHGAAQSQEQLAEKTAEATGKIKSQAEVVSSARGANRDWQESIDDASAAIKENGRTVDDNTEKGRANNAALDGMADAARDVADAVVAAGGTEVDYRRSLEKSRPQIVATARAMGYSADQAEGLASELLGIPRRVNTTIGTNAGAAIGAVKKFKSEFYALSGAFVGVSIGVSGIGALGGRRAGGPIGAAAAGGGRSGLTWTGENGPELINAQPGTMVHDAATSRQIARRGGGPGGGGGGPLVVHLDLDGRTVASVLIDPLRREVTRLGGNVQTALGDNRGQLIA